jgi:uncharacterized protein YcfJ
METIKTANRIHPLMAAAAVSVIAVSVAGTAAITGMLPNSHSAPAPQLSAIPPAPSALAAAPMTLAAAPVAAPAPAAVQEAPVVKHKVQRPRPVQHHYTQVAHNDAPSYRAPAVQAAPPQPSQPNYLGIGAGAVIGGLIGNQVGGGNGKKLATVAGVIGGGMLGNEIANRNK